MPQPTGLRSAPPEITDIVSRLIADHFPYLANARLAVMVRPQAAEADDEEGKLTVAATGVNRADERNTSFDYLIWFALDAWAVMDATEREALVYHELKHCGRDEAGKPKLIPHDAGVFDSELEQYGAWWSNARRRFKRARSAGESRNGNAAERNNERMV